MNKPRKPKDEDAGNYLSICIPQQEVTHETINLERRLFLQQSYKNKSTRKLMRSIIGTDFAAYLNRRDTTDLNVRAGIIEVSKIILVEHLNISDNFKLNFAIEDIHIELKQALNNYNHQHLSVISSLSPGSITNLFKPSAEKCVKLLIMYQEIGFIDSVKESSSILIQKKIQGCKAECKRINRNHNEQNKTNRKYLIDRIHERGNID